jgi:hypothetical protein
MVNSLLLAGYNFTMKIKGLIFRYFLGKLDGRRKAGRPKLKELDDTENGLKSRDVKRCTKKDKDRSAWAIIVK